MADYQSLLTRAVANLPPSSTAPARQAIYERARKALVTQLRSLRPPLPESDIQREETALDKAIEAVESKFAPAAAGQATSKAPTVAEAAPPAGPSPPSPRLRARRRLRRTAISRPLRRRSRQALTPRRARRRLQSRRPPLLLRRIRQRRARAQFPRRSRSASRPAEPPFESR